MKKIQTAKKPPFLIPEKDFKKKMPLRDSVVLAVEAAKAGSHLGAQQVIVNLRSKFGADLVPESLDVKEFQIPHDAIPFGLNYAEGMDDAGMALPGSLEIDPTDDIILDNFGTLLEWGKEWLGNLSLCAGLIHADHDARGDAMAARSFDLSRLADPTQAVVVGSGSSLDELAEFLPRFPGLVICGPTNASAVARAGRLPDAILAIDSGSYTVLNLEAAPWDDLGVPLILSTIMHPDAARLFPRTRQWFTSIIQMAHGAQHPFNVFQHMLFPFIRTFMFQAGCTINGEILLLNMLEELKRTKFRAVYLLGVDFAYKQHASRCRSFTSLDGLSWSEREAATSRQSIQTSAILKRAANGMVTDETMLTYKRSLLTCGVITRLPLYDASDGIITEVPKVDFQRFARDDFKSVPPEYTYQSVLDAYNAYLTRVGYVAGETSGTEGTDIEGELWGRTGD